MKNRTFFAVFCSLLGACAVSSGVHGNLNPESQGANATIIASYEHNHPILGGLDHSVFIAGVDDENFGGRNNYDPQIMGLSAYPDKIEIRPGLHSITIFHSHFGTRTSGCLWIRAEPGKQYIVTAQTSQNSGKFILREAISGKEVGGDCSSAPVE